MKKAKNMEKHAAHGFSQFRLTNNLLNNLSQFEITPAAKLVLLYLSSCYNPKKADMFPKQKTIAAKIGISERSVVRAVQELFKAGLIIIECKYTNRYKFTSQIVSQPPEIEKNFAPENMSDELSQNDIQQGDNFSEHNSKPMSEHKKEPAKVEEYKILKQYAQEKGAKNVTAYINALKKNGSAARIIKDFKEQNVMAGLYAARSKETRKNIEEVSNLETASYKDCERLKEVLMKNWGIKKA